MHDMMLHRSIVLYLLSLPIFQKADGPEGHEHREEDRSPMVEEVAYADKRACRVQIPRTTATFHVAQRAHEMPAIRTANSIGWAVTETKLNGENRI